jgi:putative membrane protein
MSEGEREVADATRRTRLANERTYLAWLRSALTALAVAIGAGKIVPGVADVESWPFELLGAGFAVLAVIFIVGGARRFVSVERSLEAGRYSPLGPAEAALLATVATALAIATLALVFVR